ncbi:Uncharacterised protein [Mycobacterium tuberculosis]|nr:Uncharacterised protein [Mycobacterium tuberculosis]
MVATQVSVKAGASRADARVMIGALSVVISCSRSGLATPVNSEMTNGSAADSAKNDRKPCRNAS